MAPETTPTEFEQVLASLEGLTREQIAEQMKAYVSPSDAEAFAVLIDGLSTDAVRFLSARALLRLRPAPAG